MLLNLIFILIGFVGVAIGTSSPPRGPRSKTLCIIFCWTLAGGGIVGAITTSAGKIKELEATRRDSDQMINEVVKAVARHGWELKLNHRYIVHGEEKIKDMNENAQRLLSQLVAQGGLSPENKKKIDAVLVTNLGWPNERDEAMDYLPLGSHPFFHPSR